MTRLGLDIDEHGRSGTIRWSEQGAPLECWCVVTGDGAATRTPSPEQ